MDLPQKKYDIIYADPPWQYGDKFYGRGASSKYPTMTTNEICKIPVKDIAEKDCVLFVWATFPMIGDALSVINGWGFDYKTVAFIWDKRTKNDKPAHSFGKWTLGNTEPLLLATRGKCHHWRINRGLRQLQAHERLRHSEKPDLFRRLIVDMLGDRPRIELFARATVPGWDAWGSEVESGF